MLTNAPKGTKDIMPQQVYKWHYIEEKWRNICERYGFKEIRTPMFEHTELFQRGIGDTTDVVQKEMYTFTDHGGRSVTLKPEGTSPAVRAFIEQKTYAEVQPTKVYYDIPCFRYEKPQSGRLREFHQFGVETFGTPNMVADAEIIAIGYDFLKSMGVTDLTLEINSVGCPKCRGAYRQKLRDFLRPVYDQLCETCQSRYEKNPMRILDCKSPIDQALVVDAPMMLDNLCDECRDAFEELKENLDAMGIPYVVNPRIVRGLDYYTKTAFEFVSNSIGAQGTVCGGGRYDNLAEEVGGLPIPGVGFGLGKERLLMLMEANGVVIPQPAPCDALIATMGKNARLMGQKLMKDLREKGAKVQMDDLQRNFKGQFKYADRINARYTIVLGDNEIEKGAATLKNMETGDQVEVKFEDLYESITK
ncbi:MAG: histidine--tRNA ligase [Firmicutes bacterium]|nr:histidine--tRNA ligase [Bacillota bacterium]MBQ1630302.1 histidine--tRNA ligase [Bacillota bacterium]MBQ1690052.1 histidine--tRNA ligase [Bacillota bacterium]MBQ1826015.1 histidine--tRNA ligase [Bacillota bacterium]